jgi:hypothetical protein
MPLRNWFGVGVRLIGLWEIVSGLDELVTFVNVVMRLYTPSLTSPNGFLTHAAAHLLIGFFLLFSAMSVVNAVYPEAIVRDEPPAVT